MMSQAFETVYSMHRLVRRIRCVADDFDLFSFDIFDTLLIRRVHDPDCLKQAVACYISRLASAKGHAWSEGKVQRLRDKVEAMHRRRTALEYVDREACYPQFMTDVLRIIFKTDEIGELLERVTAYELDIESAFLVARKEWPGLLEALESAGKTLIAVSDMYLPASHLETLLDRSGLLGSLDAVFSSADTFQAKASGAAWPLIQKQMQVDPARWLHVGDNPVSDGRRAADFGLRAFVLCDTSEKYRHLLSREYARMADDRLYWRGRLAQQWMLPLESENASVSPLFADGYTFLGPLLCAFIHHIAERCIKHNVKRIYFFSREGELLKSIWERITPVLFAGCNRLPKASYLYVSRLALATPSCAKKGLTLENAQIAFLPATNRNFSDLCQTFGLNVERLKPFLAEYGLTEETPLSHWQPGWCRQYVDRFRRLLEEGEDFQNEVRLQAEASNQALQRYLESEHFFDDEDVAVVDIGWLGTIQRFLFDAIAHRSDAPRLHGHLMASSGGYPFPYHDRNRLEGFMFDMRHFDFAGSLVLYAHDLFEETTRAHHAGLICYRLNKENGFSLVFKDAEDPSALNEREQSDYFTPLQEGILKCAERYGPVMAVLGYSSEEWRSWLHVQNVSRLAFPRTNEVKRLTHIHHIDDFQQKGRVPARAKSVMRRLWNRPIWQLRWLPWIRPWHYLKHAVHWLRM
jgi:FMN phosphatase YigB (HAD superfamily)